VTLPELEVIGGGLCFRPLRQPLAALIESYSDAPEMFLRQFGRPVDQRDLVLHEVDVAVKQGLSSYFALAQVCTGSWIPIGHIRVDWHGAGEASLGLHGGSPHPVRFQAHERFLGWQLAIRSAFADDSIDQITSVTAADNRPAQVMLAASGFRRIRLTRSETGRWIAHYSLVRKWTRRVEALRDWAGLPLTAFKPAPSISFLEPHIAPWPVPQGWHRIDASEENEWVSILYQNLPWASYLADLEGQSESHPFTILQTLRFAAKHGTAFFGCRLQGCPVAALAAESFPQRPGWLRLRGGPWDTKVPVTGLYEWISNMYSAGIVSRVEVIVPAADSHLADWWRHEGFELEGVTEVDAEGLERRLLLVWKN
jgi:hypothetical protein